MEGEPLSELPGNLDSDPLVDLAEPVTSSRKETAMGRNGSTDQDGSQQDDVPDGGQGGGDTSDTATGWIEVESIKESQDTDDVHYF